MDDQKLLAAFPRPPPGTSSAVLPSTPVSSPRPSDFGFIKVEPCHEDDADSLYNDPPKNIDSNATQPASLPIMHNSDFGIVLDNSTRTYSPCDTVTGYIAGWHAAAHIQIILEGRVKSYMREAKMQYKDRAPLLYENVNCMPPTNNMTPRFSVIIPERAVKGLERLHEHAPTDAIFGRYWTSDWPAQEPYESQAGHPLPPSMTLPFRNLQASGWGHISYKLIAVRSEFDNATGKLIPNASCQVPLRLTTRRLSPSKIIELLSKVHSNTSDLSIQTAQLSKTRPLAIREQLRDVFNTGAPAFYFKAITSSPKLSMPGARLQVAVAVAILPPPPGHLYNFPVPNITIVRLTFRIRSYTGLRVQRQFPDERKPPKSYTFKGYEMETRQSPSGAIFTPKNGAYEGQSCVSNITLPATILPSFKTYNLWRGYRLESEVTFSVAGKDVSAKTACDLNIVISSSGSADATGGMRQEIDAEDDAVNLEMAQAIVLAGLRLGSTAGVR
jgi:hypothetical protein